jgi:hypothetical protein
MNSASGFKPASSDTVESEGLQNEAVLEKSTLKVPKRENFSLAFFALSEPI